MALPYLAFYCLAIRPTPVTDPHLSYHLLWGLGNEEFWLSGFHSQKPPSVLKNGLSEVDDSQLWW